MLPVVVYTFKTDFTKKVFLYGRCALFSAHLWLFILYLLLAPQYCSICNYVIV